MPLFLSYARPDRSRVDSLVSQLRYAGIEVWLDSDLIGGWPWWDKILGQIRSCDAVVATVSRASINSRACSSEREYAAQLGKPILPITLDPMPAGLFPADIARIQVIDYTRPDQAAAFKLAGAIFALPEPAPLPNPLPRPPAMPPTRFGDLNERISAPSLSLQDQLGILGMLEAGLGPSSDLDDQQTAVEMLNEMMRRHDLYEVAARKIQILLKQARGSGQKAPWRVAHDNSRWNAAPPRTGVPRTEAPPRAARRTMTAPPQPGQASPGTVKTRRKMAVTSLILSIILPILLPAGITALVFSFRVKSSLAAGDIGRARQASSRVAIAFWIIIVIWVMVIIIYAYLVIHAASGSTAAAAASRSSLR